MIDLVAQEVKFVAVRSRGPGGQNVNKVSSAAILLWDFENSRYLDDVQKILIREKLDNVINKDREIFLRSDVHRDLEQNKQSCLEKLNRLLQIAFFKPKPRKPTKPTRSSKAKRLDSKKHRGEIKQSRRKEKY